MTETAEGGSLLDERLEIETPERVKIVYDVAGIGSRFAAGLVDSLLLAFVFGILFVVVSIAATVAAPKSDETRMAFGLAVIGAFSVLLLIYYVGFECVWSGQTPGKRLLRLRVISETGEPATAGAIFLRNLLRIADLMPGAAPYGLGGIVMFANRRAKRIGDFAAGTVVVRERAEPLAAVRVAAAETLPGDALSAADLARVQAFVARAPQMIRASREALAARIAGDVAARYRLAYEDAEAFLRSLARGAAPKDLRDARGPAS
jgi:uncharacterized RDD family membrane protein YckC